MNAASSPLLERKQIDKEIVLCRSLGVQYSD